MTVQGGGIILGPGEGEHVSVMGNDLTLKAASTDTGGALGLMEYTASPGFAGPPPHIHRKTIEAFYILEGSLTLQIGDQTTTGGPSTFVLVPPGSVHTFSNAGEGPAKFLLIVSPGGFEKYFRELARIMARHGYPAPGGVMKSLGEQYDFEIVPQSGTES